MKAAKKWIFSIAAALLIGVPVGVFAGTAVSAGVTTDATNQLGTNPSSEQVRHELATLPYYGIFDNLGFSIQGDTVILEGQVVKPITRSDAQARVSRVKGVSKVINNIQVLPLSSFDNAIRLREYRTIFRTGSLFRYAEGVNPGIHIIVSNGRVTLEGVVDTAADRQLAYIAANGVPGVFGVTNNLRVEAGK
ncbi:MAG: BON domain-containing protein [Blastocatellia bacterium]